MKCPHCLSIMKCRSIINPIPGQPRRSRMDLHCLNRQFCKAQSHMGVLTEDPKVWECHEYSFSFNYEGNRYILISHNYVVDPFLQSRDPKLAMTRLAYSFGSELCSLPYFIPLSTGDDMHEEAWKLFHRLRKLVIFS